MQIGAFVFLCSQQHFFDRLYVIYTVGYAVSFSSLMVAILIIGYFRYEIISQIIFYVMQNNWTTATHNQLAVKTRSLRPQ